MLYISNANNCNDFFFFYKVLSRIHLTSSEPLYGPRIMLRRVWNGPNSLFCLLLPGGTLPFALSSGHTASLGALVCGLVWV